MDLSVSPALEDYLPAFNKEGGGRGGEGEGEGERGCPSTPFLSYYDADRKPFGCFEMSRDKFWNAAEGFGRLMVSSLGLKQEDCVTHYFTGNRVEDLVLRLSSVMVGTTPVTINWQADTTERALFKIQTTNTKVVVVDKNTPSSFLSELKGVLGGEIWVVRPVVGGRGEGGEVGEVWMEVVFSPSDLENKTLKPENCPPLVFTTATQKTDDRIIIFTSGTTGNPKGVRLSYNSYVCNRGTFEGFLLPPSFSLLSPFSAVVTNPMHHTNSTSITDWCLRRPNARLHLLSRYTTPYWSVVVAAAGRVGLEEVGKEGEQKVLEALDKKFQENHTVVCPLVSRHIDFLSDLTSSSRLPLPQTLLRAASKFTTFLLGSAPVGPTTVQRMLGILGCLPTVRFGSTETCLQVMGTQRESNDTPKNNNNIQETPLSGTLETTLSDPSSVFAARRKIRCMEKGWGHTFKGEKCGGYYIGGPHRSFTEVMVVRGVDKEDKNTYFVECEEGEPGQIITRGQNLMTSYVGMADVSFAIHKEAGGWYINLGDVAFWLKNDDNPERKDFYWVARTSSLLIKGGANYSYEQISTEIRKWIETRYNLTAEDVAVGVVGLNLSSEHEDDCCVMIQLMTEKGKEKEKEINDTILAESKSALSKGSQIDILKFGEIPRNFKGAILNNELKKMFK